MKKELEARIHKPSRGVTGDRVSLKTQRVNGQKPK